MKSAFYKGFTLVELSIAIVFVGILSISLVSVMSSMLVSYRKGNMMAQVNTVGTDLVDDFREATQKSSAQSVKMLCGLYADKTDENNCLKDSAYNFVSLTHTAIVSMGGRSFKAPIYGVYCTGSYSYIWNSGYYESSAVFDEKNTGEWATLKVKNTAEPIGAGSPFRLLKVYDPDRDVCRSAYDTDGYDAAVVEMKNHEIDISGRTMSEEPEQMLISRGSGDLAIYDLTISKPVANYNNNSVFYYGSFILGTVNGGVDITSINSACVTPSEYDYVYDYCAINKFSFAVRASGG